MSVSEGRTSAAAFTRAHSHSLRRLLAAGATATALALAASPAAAATYTAHDGVSLGAAVSAADSQPGASTIDLSPGVYTPDTTLTISGDVTINGPSGPGSKIVGSAVTPVGSSLFEIGPNAHATFVDLTVTTAGSVGGDPAVDVAGAVDLEGSTLAGNSGPDLTVEPGATATVRDSTLSDGLGAGLVDDGAARVLNSTIADNAVEGIDDSVGTLSLVNTIVAENGSPDCSAPAASSDHSLDGDGTCGVGLLSAVNPHLGPLLASNGGPTPTRALEAGSRAINAGDDGQCPATDQRGYARSDGQCDIGAYEAGAQPSSAGTSGSGGPSAVGGSGSGATGGSKKPAGGSGGSAGGGSATGTAPTGASGHGSLRGPRRSRITFVLEARIAKPHGSLTYHDAMARVWLRRADVSSVTIDSTRGTATIRGSGTDSVSRRHVSFTGVLTDGRGVRRLTLRLSNGYAGGGPLVSGAIALTRGGRPVSAAATRSMRGDR